MFDRVGPWASASATYSCSRTASPADPTAFLTAIPSWREGDEFLAGSDLRRFRIVAIDEPPSDDFYGLFVVEAVD